MRRIAIALLAATTLVLALTGCGTVRRALNPPPATLAGSLASAALAPAESFAPTCGLVSYPDQRGRVRTVATAGLQLRQQGVWTRVMPLQGDDFITPFPFDKAKDHMAAALCRPKAAPVALATGESVVWEGVKLPPSSSGDTRWLCQPNDEGQITCTQLGDEK